MYRFINYPTKCHIGTTTLANDGFGGTSPGCPDSIHTSINALNLYSQLTFISQSAMAVVAEI